MKKSFFKTFSLLFIGLLAVALMFNACKKDDDDGATTAIELLSFGPSPALRGGELRFIGHNLDQVTAIILPNDIEVTSFATKSPELIVIGVPQETVEGYVTLKTPKGDIRTKTILTISEPIKFTSFSPATLRPGGTLTIEGDYLNLIKAVIFSNNKAIGDTAFISQTREKLEVPVPDDAQTGFVVISNGEEIPILIESPAVLEVTLPQAVTLSPNPVKAGTNLTIEGTDMDLTKEVIFSGGGRVSSFVSIDPTKVVVQVPADAKDGKIKLAAASLVEVESSADLVMAVPTISSVSPNPAKNGGSITVSGTDLDLIVKATFGGAKDGTITPGSTTQITVSVPLDASEGAVTFTTAADKTVASSNLTLVQPTISAIAPMDVQASQDITISGTNLDVVDKVKFTGGTEIVVAGATTSSATVAVPVGSQSGPITLVMFNGTEVTSSQSLTVLASTSALITGMPDMAAPGDMISIVGENLDQVNEVVFPVDIPATMFGQKTATLIEVFIPLNVQLGIGKLKLITFDGEMIESPEINIQGVDPVDDPTLVFFNFDNLNSWWGDAGAPENNTFLSLDGSSYFRVNQTCNGWTGYFWRNAQNDFPASTIGTNVADYSLKFDINVLEPITGGEFAWRFKGSSGDFWYYWKPWQSSGMYQTNGWITITIPLTEFYSGADQLADMTTITEDFGVAFNNGTSLVNVCIDNVRFEHN